MYGMKPNTYVTDLIRSSCRSPIGGIAVHSCAGQHKDMPWRPAGACTWRCVMNPAVLPDCGGQFMGCMETLNKSAFPYVNTFK